ncbi:AlpA family transcriptional regulator [Aquitalea aquatilis]|uniref:AlpA family transcriptional regulator n=1 Tax=Aquitalea aquatilis TaxID=1537400 RepID=UPI0010BDFAC5|nr:AlpA family transcriptional regulator [Aquitalea aquatilis]
MSNQNSPVQILRIKDVIAVTGLSRSSIYNKISPKSIYYDKSFPKSFKLGERAIGWLEGDIEQWILETSKCFHTVENVNGN